MKETIGIIGFGNMGQAIAQQLKEDYQIYASDKDKNKLKKVIGIEAAKSNVDLLKRVRVLLLAVKPQDITEALMEIKNYLGDRLIITIAAGISTDYIEKFAARIRVIRAMPNLPAKIACGVTCLARGKFASENDFEFSCKLFSYLGQVIKIKEDLMNAATAVSGSGPAYVCEFIESEKLDIDHLPEAKQKDFLTVFQEAAQSVGFSQEEAALLVNTTFTGTIKFLQKTRILPDDLKRQVTSKGGTTEAALEVLHRGGTLESAVKAALGRAQDLSRQEVLRWQE